MWGGGGGGGGGKTALQLNSNSNTLNFMTLALVHIYFLPNVTISNLYYFIF